MPTEQLNREQLALLIRQRPEPDPLARWQAVRALCVASVSTDLLEQVSTTGERVGQVAVLIGRTLGVNAATLKRLRLAGRLHALGALVAETTENETACAKPADAADAACRVEVSAELSALLGAADRVVDAIRWQGRRFDEAERDDADLPFEARVLAVAVAFVAMTSGPAVNPETSNILALQELRRQKGRRFDPVVVEAAICVLGRLAAAAARDRLVSGHGQTFAAAEAAQRIAGSVRTPRGGREAAPGTAPR